MRALKKTHDLKKIPLRERKKAQTRLAIMDAMIERMRGKALADITVEEVCGDVQISRGTFFQYFPQKTDVLVLFALLWNLETLWKVTRAPDASPGLRAIEAMFLRLGEQVEEHPRLWAEVIATRALQPEVFAYMGGSEEAQVGRAERLLRFPDLEGIESVPEGNFRHFFELNLETALREGDLPAETDLTMVFTSLACIFYGVPLMSFEKKPMNCRESYMRQLHQLWKALGAKGPA